MNRQHPNVMAAVLLNGRGDLTELEYRKDVPVPKVEASQVLVRVGACGLNRSDINTRIGWYGASWNGKPVRYPLIQGSAIVGTVSGVGRNVNPERLGERVIVEPIIRDQDRPTTAQTVAYIGADLDGGYADYVAVPDRNAYAVSSTLSDAQLATFPVSYATAEEMLTRASLGDGETIVVTGASGGVGTALIQLAGLRGARIVAVAGQSKIEQVRELGAASCVPRECEDLEAALTEAAGGEGHIDVVADVMGGTLTAPLLSALKPGGRYSVGGSIAGLQAEICLRDVIYKDLELYGTASSSEKSFTTVLRHVESGRLKPLLYRAYPLQEIHAAQQQLAEHNHVGKIVVTPNDLSHNAVGLRGRPRPETRA